MKAAPLPPELRAAAPAVALRAAAILLALAALIARAFLRSPRHVGIIIPLWTRLNRAARRLSRVMNHVAAGTLRAHKPRPGARSGPGPATLPTSRAWLVAALRHEAVAYGSQLNHLMAEPAAAAIIAATPQAARILRPICHMLGIAPASLPALPRAARARPRPPAPRPPAPRPPAPHLSAPSLPPPRPPAPRLGQLPVPHPRPLHETVPCPHVMWPWFPRRYSSA